MALRSSKNYGMDRRARYRHLGKGAGRDKIKALTEGGRLLTKPFGAGELLARIRVALRHAAAKSQDQGKRFSSPKTQD